MRITAAAAAVLLAGISQPAFAQDVTAGPDQVQQANDAAGPGRPATVFDGDWISVGAGVVIGPSYIGSDDYVFSPIPIVQGSIGGIGISPRGAGLALDLIPDSGDGVSYSLGPSFRLRRDRANQIEDEVVELAGELDTAFEIGASAGVSFPGVLNEFDSLTFSSDIRWDVAGAHDGMVVEPGVSYLTPLSEGIVTILSISGEYVDDDFADYYFSVNPEQSAASGLPLYQADGGFTSVGANLVLGFDLDGDIRNGGFAITTVAGYSRLLGDAKDTPYTSIRGSADQFVGILGLAYTF